MIEAHKGRHHNAKGGSGVAGHWDANNVDKSYNSGANNESTAGHQRAPLFDWESGAVVAAGGSSNSWDNQQQKTDEQGEDERIQEVTTTLGQTAFLHCRVRYLADRRVISFSFLFSFFLKRRSMSGKFE